MPYKPKLESWQFRGYVTRIDIRWCERQRKRLEKVPPRNPKWRKVS